MKKVMLVIAVALMSVLQVSAQKVKIADTRKASMSSSR